MNRTTNNTKAAVAATAALIAGAAGGLLLNPGTITEQEAVELQQAYAVIDARLEVLEDASMGTRYVGDVDSLRIAVDTFEAMFVERYLYDAAPLGGDPPTVDPPVVDPPPTYPGYGCPPTAILQPIPFRQVANWWPDDPRETGGVAQLFEVYRDDFSKRGNTDRGLFAGLADDVDDLTFRNGKVKGLSFWGANGHLAGVRIENVSFYDTDGEHDIYVKLIGGGSGFYFVNGLSRDAASQRIQIARREWEMSEKSWLDPPGPIVVDGDYCVNQGLHPDEGGTGTRISQAYKFFSQQPAKRVPILDEETGEVLDYRLEKGDTWEQVPTTVLMQRVTLDNSMQGLSTGPFFIGDYLDVVVRDCVFRGGELVSHATIDHGFGPVLIEDCHFDYKTRGIKLRSATRPVTIRNCTGDFWIMDANGNRLATIEEGWIQ